jgi:Xaa-Pro dipeptidase
VRAGDTEMDIASALTRGIYTHGAEYFKLMIVATGERSVFPNVGPTTRKLRRGDVCRVEIFPMIGGYHVGVCRTAVVGEAPPHAERIWVNLSACKQLLLDVMLPGTGTRRIYDVYLQKLRELGLPPISFIGHGMGLHLHEDPYLGPTPDQPLEPGMVLAFEPLIFETGFGFGMQIKDVVVIGEQGCELLSTFTKTDRLLVVADDGA